MRIVYRQAYDVFHVENSFFLPRLCSVVSGVLTFPQVPVGHSINRFAATLPNVSSFYYAVRSY
jgi:hypothetical protein